MSVEAERWAAVDRYVSETILHADEALEATLRDSAAAGLPAINVSAPQGKLLHLLAKMLGARRILEIGTLGGYSTIWMARALPPGGKLISLELEEKHAKVARANLGRAGVGDRVEIQVGRAIDLLPGVSGPFDLIFIDADKASMPEYFHWAVQLSRSGSAIVADNVVRNGAVIDAASADPSIIGVRKLNEQIALDPRVTATTIQTVGGKGYDGFTLAYVL